MEGFTWNDLHKILHGGPRMAKVYSGEEISQKASVYWVGCTNITDDKQICDNKDPNVTYSRSGKTDNIKQEQP